MAAVMPTSQDEQADFLLRTIVPFFKNDLDSIAESRCPAHARGGGALSFSLTVMSLAACEVIAELDSTAARPKDRRREIFARISSITGDPRYADLGEILFVVFRHGIAHTFLPKGASAVGGMTMWLVDGSSKNLCIEHVRANLASYRAGEHLRLDFTALIVYPQVLYLDVEALLNDFEARLRDRDAATLSRLQANFKRWWDDNALIRPDHLNQHEWDLVNGNRVVTPLLVTIGPKLAKGAERAQVDIYRVQRGFRVITMLNGVSTSEDAVDDADADDQLSLKVNELRQSGFVEVC